VPVTFRTDILSTTGLLAMPLLLPSLLSSSLESPLVTDRGLCTLFLDPSAEPLQALDSDVLEPLCTLSLTSGTRSLPSAPRFTIERSRRCDVDMVAGNECADVGDVGTDPEWADERDSDRRLND